MCTPWLTCTHTAELWRVLRVTMWQSDRHQSPDMQYVVLERSKVIPVFKRFRLTRCHSHIGVDHHDLINSSFSPSGGLCWEIPWRLYWYWDITLTMATWKHLTPPATAVAGVEAQWGSTMQRRDHLEDPLNLSQWPWLRIVSFKCILFLNVIYETGADKKKPTKGSEALTAAPAEKSNCSLLMAIALISHKH